MDIPAGLAAEAGQAKLNIALSVIKQTAEQDRKLVDILDKAARTAPVSHARGSNVSIKA